MDGNEKGAMAKSIDKMVNMLGYIPLTETEFDMTDEEMKEAYEEDYESDFFESVDDADQLERVLGASVMNDYANWLYLHVK